MMDYFKLLEKISSIRRNKEFLILDENRYSYDHIYKASKLLGENIKNIIRKDNINVGKFKILIYSENLYFQIISFFASNFSNCIPIISHYNLPEKALNHIVMSNNIQFVLEDNNLSWNLEGNKYILQDFDKIFLHEIHVNKLETINSKVCMGALTSGSTGVPKVLYRTYESWAGFFKIQNNIFKINSQSKLFINGSISFTGNLNVIMSILYEGGTIVSESKLNFRKWINIIYKEKIDNIYLVPTKLKILNNFLDQPINFVRSIFTGSQLLFEDTIYKLKYKFPNSQITLYYGASELNYITYLNYEGINNKPLSVGKPFPNVELSIKDNFIYVNTKYQVEGMENPCTVFDMGEIDRDGELIFYGRKDNVINKGGIKISGVKIENEIKKINGINDVAVVGYNHDKKGNEIAAFIIADKKIRKKDIIQKLRNILTNTEIPKKMIFVNNIPLNNSGKVDRIKLINENIYK